MNMVSKASALERCIDSAGGFRGKRKLRDVTVMIRWRCPDKVDNGFVNSHHLEFYSGLFLVVSMYLKQFMFSLSLSPPGWWLRVIKVLKLFNRSRGKL